VSGCSQIQLIKENRGTYNIKLPFFHKIDNSLFYIRQEHCFVFLQDQETHKLSNRIAELEVNLTAVVEKVKLAENLITFYQIFKVEKYKNIFLVFILKNNNKN